MFLCKLSDDQNVYGAADGTLLVYSLGKAHRFQFKNNGWVEVALWKAENDDDAV